MYILIDIGGTKTRVTITEHREAFQEPVVFPTPQNFEEWFTQFVEAANTLLQGKKVNGVIVGAPCTLDENKSVIRHAPHLKPWEGINLREKLSERFSCECLLNNDTALVGLGEATFGAGKGYPIVAYVTISTGVNGVRITDGKIDKSITGFEIGHTVIEASTNKTVEEFISGSALEARFGRPSREVHDVKLWEEVNHYAGIFGANTAMYWSPSIIVYGGPVMNDLHIEIIEREARQIATVYDKMPVFVRGTLKDFGGLYGALALSKEIQ